MPAYISYLFYPLSAAGCKSATAQKAGIEKMVNGLYEIEPAVVSRVQQILEAK